VEIPASGGIVVKGTAVSLDVGRGATYSA